MERQDIKLIPVPKRLAGSGESKVFCPKMDCDYPQWEELKLLTKDAFYKLFDVSLPDGEGGLRLIFDPKVEHGAYCLCADGEAEIRACDYEGARYGLASFLQLIQKERRGFSFPQVQIFDQPEKDHRGFMVDLARWWHPKRTILAYLDLCFFYKIKYMHLHFADNQSYTLPSKAFPLLPTENRHYSFEEIAQIRAYAKARGIVLIPEIEMPGHGIPLNGKYPEIFMDRTSDGYLQNLNKTPTVICAGSEACFRGLTQLIDEVMEMFPDSPYLHLGGDEAAIETWEHCDVCRSYMESHCLHTAKELYSDFTARITRYVLEKGKIPMVWEGFPREASHLIPKETVVMAWECLYNQPEDLLDDGFTIINCAWKPLYICPGKEDWGYRDILAWNVYNMQNFNVKSRATKDPVNLAPTDRVLGAQLCVWEACYEYEIHPTVVSMAAFSERMWESKPVCGIEAFDAKFNAIRSKAYRLIQEH